MSIKIIEEQIYRFLKSDTPEVIAIRGAWGVWVKLMHGEPIYKKPKKGMK
jgi:hypothetical protein